LTTNDPEEKKETQLALLVVNVDPTGFVSRTGAEAGEAGAGVMMTSG
jgi:hypothetical protein